VFSLSLVSVRLGVAARQHRQGSWTILPISDRSAWDTAEARACVRNHMRLSSHQCLSRRAWESA